MRANQVVSEWMSGVYYYSTSAACCSYYPYLTYIDREMKGGCVGFSLFSVCFCVFLCAFVFCVIFCVSFCVAFFLLPFLWVFLLHGFCAFLCTDWYISMCISLCVSLCVSLRSSGGTGRAREAHDKTSVNSCLLQKRYFNVKVQDTVSFSWVLDTPYTRPRATCVRDWCVSITDCQW